MRVFVLILLTVLNLSATAHAAQKRVIVGYIERVHIQDLETTFKAKLDTGATTSSMDARILKVIEPDAEQQGDKGSIIFSVQGDGEKATTLERKIQRWVRIKTKDGGYIRRPVVIMNFCIAGQLISNEVNLSDRENFLYPVLIGRNMLSEGTLIIDPSIKYTSKPTCPQSKETVE